MSNPPVFEAYGRYYDLLRTIGETVRTTASRLAAELQVGLGDHHRAPVSPTHRRGLDRGTGDRPDVPGR